LFYTVYVGCTIVTIPLSTARYIRKSRRKLFSHIKEQRPVLALNYLKSEAWKFFELSAS
jgi:hypothetical protein